MENKVYAKVGEKEITDQDIQMLLSSIGPQNAQQFQGEQGKKNIVSELINQELMYIDAKNNKIDTDEEFQKEVEKVKESLLKQYAVKKLVSKITVAEEEKKEFYENNKEMFIEGDKARASHILVKTEEKARELLGKIMKGNKFEDLAKEESECPSKDNGGDLGEFQRGNMVPEFEEATFAMKKGEISEPVKTQFGYHIIKLIDKQEKREKSYEEVSEEIEKRILGNKQMATYFKKIEELKKDIKIEILD